MRTRSTTRPPVLERLVLPALEDADAAQLAAQEHHEGLRLDGADLTGDFPLGVSNRRLEGQPATVSVRRGTLLIFQGV